MTAEPAQQHRQYAHKPVNRLTSSSTGDRRSDRTTTRRYIHTPTGSSITAPLSPPTRSGRGISTRHELYEWHKANGTLQEFYRMYGLD